ncbi:uncharacterized protein LOC122376067 [Amphibalanus amphitrite]|uniref:uncharacterized protein LOC122376067 n=1 Tax=Amphibalanus amphitrite TaxID=1232801 RepID=UPI001C8FEA05|nr:uncharacterized protein LOC122376067 [Amphibalanus amphitrite]
MRAAPLLLLGLAALLAAGDAQDTANCDLGDPAGLSDCIKQLLVEARPKVAQEADPLRLPNNRDGDVELSNIRVHGISGYSVDGLSVSFPSDQQIAVRATISWPHINGKLDAKIRKCKKVIFKKVCVSVRGRPEVRVGRTVGSLTTTLNVHVGADGRIMVTASGTRVSLNLASIRVKANLRGAIGFFNRLFGDPASKITTKLANKWWGKNKGKIEGKARDALDKAVREKVAVHLARLLKI